MLHGRALVVEGPIMRKVLREMLVNTGFAAIDEVPGGVEAIALLQRLTYSLVVADWNMSPMSGLDLLIQMRATSRNPDTPFIMTTGKGQKRFASVARDNGATRYLEKPFTGDGLMERVREASSRLAPQQTASVTRLSVRRH